ncbi:MAG: AraC family transcriptional regulator [Clostridia bacterium]|nr:AraC family transcriptional regulator [Clostridia bacterium]
MRKETRTVCFDTDLEIEAYRFEGVAQKFPNHFHDYYVIGFMENGRRCLRCCDREYMVSAGDIVIFNPSDPHTCEQADGKAFDYRCINIEPAVMKKAMHEITGGEWLPRFSENVLYQNELAQCLKELHQMIFEEAPGFGKEELFLLLLRQLLGEYSDARIELPFGEPSPVIKSVCEYLEENFAGAVTLNDLSKLCGLSKYHLLRSFTREKGISPYCYLENIRIGRAKKLLENGVMPAEAAIETGFSDQSHFSNYFKKLIGLTPRQYMNIFSPKAEAPESAESGAG